MLCYIKNKEAVGLVVLKKTIFLDFPIMRLLKPVTFKYSRFGSQGHDLQALLRGLLAIAIYTKHISCEPHDVYDFSYYKSIKAIALCGHGQFRPKGSTSHLRSTKRLQTLLYQN